MKMEIFTTDSLSELFLKFSLSKLFIQYSISNIIRFQSLTILDNLNLRELRPFLSLWLQVKILLRKFYLYNCTFYRFNITLDFYLFY